MKKRIFSIIMAAVVLTMSLTGFAFAANNDYTVLGTYKEHGYVNEYFHYDLTLPADFELSSRGLLNLVNSNVVEDANKEDTLSYLSTMLNLSQATVFEADNGYDFITISVENPGFMKDYWDEEKVIAENSVQSIVDALEALNSDNLSITDISTQVDYIDDFVGQKHYAILYMYAANGTPVYGVNILVRSSDRKYLNTINIETLIADDVASITNLFAKK